MKHFVVTLELMLGDAEKNVAHLVEAEDSLSAEKEACLLEMHGDALEYDETSGFYYDDAVNFAYRAMRVVEVEEEDYPTLKKYFL
jgi:hypothetical protein